MNHSILKKFAAEARKNFRSRIEARLAHWIAGDSVEHRTHRALIDRLKAELEKIGKATLVDRVAYTWFNRFAALRLLDTAGHPFGGRVITAVEGRTRPEILEKALAGDIPEKLTEADRSLVPTIERLQTSGRADTETALYRALLLAACHFYGQKMPFLFEQLDDFAELLLPDDLLSDHSLLADFRTALADDDCREVEVLGWLYQYYIAERKGEVMARKAAVPTEDIPAVTQLFTPHWIVRYLVENSLGRLWLLNRPASKLRDKMPYFVEGDPVTDFLKIEKPEDIKVFDPACGSGHMLTYAFDLLKEIYAEEGHSSSDAARLILENNLYGADLCPRAAALAGFALVMKARELDSRLLNRATPPPAPSILTLTDVKFDAGEIQNFAKELDLGALFDDRLKTLLTQFEHATTFGSLIRPVLDASGIAFVRDELAKKARVFEENLFLASTYGEVLSVLRQAEFLADGRYQVVVVNPPYMGGKGMNGEIKAFMKEHFEPYKSDLFSAFIIRSRSLAHAKGQLGFMTPFVWMFISSYEELRKTLIAEATITTLVQLEYSGFDGATVPICTFAFQNNANPEFKGGYIKLSDFRGSENQAPKTLEAIANPQCGWFFRASSADFAKIPSSPVAYWTHPKLINCFSNDKIDAKLQSEGSLKTGNNDRFIRNLWEVSFNTVSSSGRWRKHPKGGSFRKWYGNTEHAVKWDTDSISHYRNDFIARIPVSTVWDINGITWTAISSSSLSFRFKPEDEMANNAALFIFPKDKVSTTSWLALLNSKVIEPVLSIISPTLNYLVGDIMKIPIPPRLPEFEKTNSFGTQLILRAKSDWDSFETSWDFADHPLLRSSLKAAALSETWANWDAHCRTAITEMQRLETENNRLWIDAYGLQDELKPEVPESEITLARADRRKDAAALVSYALGCLMGRYSPDQPGLILANAGDTAARYYELTGKTPTTATLPVDADGILPVLDGEWFEDDATTGVQTFLRKLWGDATYTANLTWLEASLGTDLRDYLAKDFFKDHLKTYKKRPIYWQVSSPKGAFRALFYLHRYDRDTVNRLLNDYLRAFLHKLEARLALLPTLIESAGKAEQTRLKKEAEKIEKQLKEIRDWERDTVLPFAQARLPLDLDDGVKVNYLKFPNLLTPIPGLADKEEE